MAVIKFKKETEGFSIQKDSQPKESFVGCPVQISCDSDSFVVMINNVPYYYEAAKHTFYINDVDVTGNTTVQISDSIRDDVTSGGSGGSGGGYLVYSALLFQTGTNAPELVSTDSNGDTNPFSNTIGNIVFSYNSVGSYLLTLAGAFPYEKTQVFITQNSSNNAYLFNFSDWAQPDQLQILTTSSNGTPTNGALNYTSIEIRVYP
jgi:hypothetical protein